MNKSYYNAESNLIAKRLRQLRKERGFSQEELAAQLQLLGVASPLLLNAQRLNRVTCAFSFYIDPIGRR